MVKKNPNNVIFPEDIAKIRMSATQAIVPIKPADVKFWKNIKFQATAKRLHAGRNLPPYYLVYFLLCELLDFPNLGMGEKVAWSVPIVYKGNPFLIEHQKFGLGIFAQETEENNFQAKQIVTLLSKGVKVGQPFFDWLATEAVKESKVNVINNSIQLFERYKFLRDSYHFHNTEAKKREDEIREQITRIKGIKIKGLKTIKVTATTIQWPAWEISQKTKWMALSTIEAFFSWTEHVFIQIAIIEGCIRTGVEINEMANEDWHQKFKRIFDLKKPISKYFYDRLIIIRRQIRNFMAHGAFGMKGEAFRWHSKIGAVPVKLTRSTKDEVFKLGGGFNFNEHMAMEIIEKFINFIWEGSRKPAKIYIQDAGLPAILKLVHNGTYKKATHSVQNMENLVHFLQDAMDRASNMDW